MYAIEYAMHVRVLHAFLWISITTYPYFQYNLTMYAIEYAIHVRGEYAFLWISNCNLSMYAIDYAIFFWITITTYPYFQYNMIYVCDRICHARQRFACSSLDIYCNVSLFLLQLILISIATDPYF